MQRAERNLAEGRERVNALRDGPFADRDLASALADVPAEYAGNGPTPLRLPVEGAAPLRQAAAAEEVVLIGREAIRNALRHADASAIEVELSYGTRCFLLHVRDDGVGIADAHAGHGLHVAVLALGDRPVAVRIDLLPVGIAIGVAEKVEVWPTGISVFSHRLMSLLLPSPST
ncbi:hypothetical protein G6F63_013913 [Rhizopus arrhizus]|nr:hypothetical protein G6F63_013913 [Rhizopus arrhizus]